MVKRLMTIVQATGFALVVVPSIGVAQDFDAGLRAYNAGDFATALREWGPLADQGNADAQFNLGIMYHQSEGVPQDYVEAVRWFRLAAEQEHPEAQAELGQMYALGKGVSPDYSEAMRLFRLSAEQGSASAQFTFSANNFYAIGSLWASGVIDGVHDDAVAVSWYRAAAEQEHAEAQSELGTMYREGRGVPRDYAEGVRWYRLSADQGNSRAQFNLGTMYREGEGVLQDYVTAYMWFNIAAANGPYGARRDRLAERMTAADISEAQRRARVCMASNYQDCD